MDKISGKQIVIAKSKPFVRILYGAGYGLLASVNLLYTIDGSNSVIIDLRYIPLLLAALFGGMLSSVTASVLLALTRLLIFDVTITSFVASGVAVITGILCGLISKLPYSIWTKWLLMTVSCLLLGSAVILHFSTKDLELVKVLSFLWLSHFFFGIACLLLSIYLRKIKETEYEIKEAFMLDYATKLLNYYGLIHKLSEYIGEAQTPKKPVTLVLLECSDWRQLECKPFYKSTAEVISPIVETIRSFFPDSMFMTRMSGGTLGFALPNPDSPGQVDATIQRLQMELMSKYYLDFICASSSLLGERRNVTELIAQTQRQLHETKKDKWIREQEKIFLIERRRSLGELAAGLAHEIRNPLTSVKGFLQLASTSGEFNRWYPFIISEIERMVELTKEFLQFSKPKGNQNRRVDLQALTEKCLHMTEPEVTRSGHQLEYSGTVNTPLPIRCDSDKIMQVLINIIKNAIDAMDKPGKITVTLKTQEQHVMLSIADTGTGIPEQYLQQIFNPFFSTKEEGTGLGLSIARKIIMEHNGNMEVSSQVGEGTTFVITLPLQQVTAASALM